jgi:uncharacterized RDD family membrane protein YckC
VAEVVTGEAVVLDVPVAAFPSRMVAVLLDLLLQYTTVVVLVIVVSSIQLNEAALTAIAIVVSVSIMIGYPTIFETLSRGKTLGKMAMGLRVVSDDGGPERFRQALIRALAGLFEFSVLAPVALFTSLLSARGKRLGDLFAGTYVIQERVPRAAKLTPEFLFVPPPLAGWAQVAEISGLSDGAAEAASSFLRRYYDLQPGARDDLGGRIAAAVAAQVSPPPPPGTPAPAYLSAVLAVRRERDRVSVAAMRSMAGFQPAPAPSQSVPAPPSASAASAAWQASAPRVPADQPSASESAPPATTALPDVAEQRPAGPQPGSPPGGFAPPG